MMSQKEFVFLKTLHSGS